MEHWRSTGGGGMNDRQTDTRTKKVVLLIEARVDEINKLLAHHNEGYPITVSCGNVCLYDRAQFVDCTEDELC